MKIDGFPPPFSFCRRQKENDGGAVKRKNAGRCAVTGAFTRPPAQRDAALNCSAQLTQPLREHGRGFAETSEPRAPCCTAQLSGKTLI